MTSGAPGRLVVAILGCGRFADHHARAARRLGGRVALAFASRDPARAEAYRRRFRGVAAFGAYEAAAADPGVHALLLATPHDLHLDGVALAARHRKPVLVEKPLARTLEEADRLLATAREAGVLLMVAENAPFMPAFAAASRLLAAGAVGTVRQVVGSARGFRRPHGWRLSREAVGGGLLIDGGIHYVRLLRQWGGEVAEVAALAPPPAFAGLEGEDTVVLMGRLRPGGVFSLALSHAAPRLPRVQWMWITGTQGSLGLESAGRALWWRGAGRSRMRVFLRDRRGLGAQLAEFVAAVREGRAPVPPAVEARADLAVVLAAYRSMATGRVVALDGPENATSPRRGPTLD